MKKHLGKVIYSTFFLLILTTINNIDNKEILAIEKENKDIIDIVDKSIRIEFSDKNDNFYLNKEKLLSIDRNFEVDECNENESKSFKAKSLNYELELLQWKEDNEYRSTISIINKDKDKRLSEVNREIKKLGFNGKDNIRYFQEIRGKLKSEDYSINEFNNILQKLNLKSNEYLTINNGICGKAIMNNDEKLTYSISDYKSGKYLIVGTPMIFSTY